MSTPSAANDELDEILSEHFWYTNNEKHLDRKRAKQAIAAYTAQAERKASVNTLEYCLHSSRASIVEKHAGLKAELERQS